jgi:hypothetical protein
MEQAGDETPGEIGREAARREAALRSGGGDAGERVDKAVVDGGEDERFRVQVGIVDRHTSPVRSCFCFRRC